MRASLPKRELLEAFSEFLTVDLCRNKRTVEEKVYYAKKFLGWLKANHKSLNDVSHENVRAYLKGIDKKPTYINTLKSLKIFFRDFLKRPQVIESFRFPKQVFKPKIIPSKEDLCRFYTAIDSVKEKALFLLYASSGLRRMEVLDSKKSDVDLEKRIIKPNAHSGETKKAWISFFNMETTKVLKQYLESRRDDNPKLFPMANAQKHNLWLKAKKKTGLNITPQRLREWFCSEMVSEGVSDSYVDAFCGRIPRSILAKHYLDYSPEKLKQIYDKANLRVLA